MSCRTIDSLPNEILDALLAPLPARTLATAALVSRRFHEAASACLRVRLLQTAALGTRELVLECHAPSERRAPSTSCRSSGMGPLVGDARLGGWYSRFGFEEAPEREVLLDEDELYTGVGDGVLRVWRTWLSDAAAGRGDVLWADPWKSVGLRFAVEPMVLQEPVGALPRRRPVSDEPAVKYRLRLEELLVRTTQVLLALDKATAQDGAQTGKAIIITSY
ncbi:Sexual differentiation process protein isp4 [Verticillium dahliae VDG1]|nr:Sexual differentiation process protein isp4 [Verticillium dahliae VDG1]